MMAHIFILTATEVNKRASNVVERREVIDKCFLGLISTLQIIFGVRVVSHFVIESPPTPRKNIQKYNRGADSGCNTINSLFFYVLSA